MPLPHNRKRPHSADTGSADEGTNGNVQVVVRIRPPNSAEVQGNYRVHIVVEAVNENILVFDPRENSNASYGARRLPIDLRKRPNKDLKFAFDHVFGEHASSTDVFNATTHSVLNSFLDGYNCSVFAYGATGAGKTHTMLGNKETPGVIYQTMLALYARIDNIKDTKTCDVAISYLEVYNETIRDLLVPSGVLPIREDPGKGVVIPGLSLHKPKSAEELLHMLQFGNQHRTQHPTDANAESSRSHAVFQVTNNCSFARHRTEREIGEFGSGRGYWAGPQPDIASGSSHDQATNVPIHDLTMTPDTKKVYSQMQQMENDEEVARKLQEQLDMEFAMALQNQTEQQPTSRLNEPESMAAREEPRPVPISARTRRRGRGRATNTGQASHFTGEESLFQMRASERSHGQIMSPMFMSSMMGSPSASGDDYEEQMAMEFAMVLQNQIEQQPTSRLNELESMAAREEPRPVPISARTRRRGRGRATNTGQASHFTGEESLFQMRASERSHGQIMSPMFMSSMMDSPSASGDDYEEQMDMEFAMALQNQIEQQPTSRLNEPESMAAREEPRPVPIRARTRRRGRGRATNTGQASHFTGEESLFQMRASERSHGQIMPPIIMSSMMGSPSASGDDYEEQMDMEFAMALQNQIEQQPTSRLNEPESMAAREEPRPVPIRARTRRRGRGRATNTGQASHFTGEESLFQMRASERSHGQIMPPIIMSSMMGSPSASGDDYEYLMNLAETIGDAKPKGLSKSQSNQLPVATYKKQDDKTEDCNICMTEYDDGDSQKILPCFHSYHAKCIDKWIVKNATCPVCRVQIKLDG